MRYSGKLWSDERGLLIQLLQKAKNNVIDHEEKQSFDEILAILIQAEMTSNGESTSCSLRLIAGYNLLCESVLECSDSPLAKNLLRKLVYHDQLFAEYVN